MFIIEFKDPEYFKLDETTSVPIQPYTQSFEIILHRSLLNILVDSAPTVSDFADCFQQELSAF